MDEKGAPIKTKHEEEAQRQWKLPASISGAAESHLCVFVCAEGTGGEQGMPGTAPG